MATTFFACLQVPCTVIAILVCVSFEKYISIIHPLFAMRILTPQLRALVMLAIWATSILFNSPYYLTAKLMRFGDMAACTRESAQRYETATRQKIVFC